MMIPVLDDNSQDSENMKMPALSSSNEMKLLAQEQKDEVSSTNTDDSESERSDDNGSNDNGFHSGSAVRPFF